MMMQFNKLSLQNCKKEIPKLQNRYAHLKFNSYKVLHNYFSGFKRKLKTKQP